MIEASGPATSGPLPADRATSEARSDSPVLRRLPPRMRSVFRAISATVTRLRGDTSMWRPSYVLSVNDRFDERVGQLAGQVARPARCRAVKAEQLGRAHGTSAQHPARVAGLEAEIRANPVSDEAPLGDQVGLDEVGHHVAHTPCLA